jgi:nitroreductase
MASQEVLTFLALRRSASAATLRAPGPTNEQLTDILRIAARVPDHGKLAPWRFVVLAGSPKLEFGVRLREFSKSQADPAKAEAALIKFDTPPTAVVVLTEVKGTKIPAWEQQLSTGAVCLNLLLAAQASGFGANWITDWYGYSPEVLHLLKAQPEERIAGFMFLGTPADPPLERERPQLADLTSWWTP